MRWITVLIGGATIVSAAWRGFTPSTASLTNTGQSLTCRPVLASIDNASLTHVEGSSNSDIAEEWMRAANALEDDSGWTTTEYAQALDGVRALCADARTGRTAWIMVTLIAGSALALGAAMHRKRAASAPAPSRST